MHKLILDTDIGTDVDDALALAVLLGSRNVDLFGITTVYGDTSLRAQIAMHICDLVNRKIKTYAGNSKPISGGEVWVSGSEGKNYQNLERFKSQEIPAVKYLIETVKASASSTSVPISVSRMIVCISPRAL